MLESISRLLWANYLASGTLDFLIHKVIAMWCFILSLIKQQKETKQNKNLLLFFLKATSVCEALGIDFEGTVASRGVSADYN